MNLRLIKVNLNYQEKCLGTYHDFNQLNQYLDQMMIESDEYLILEVCDPQGEIYFEEKINAYGGLSNKEQAEIMGALARIEKQKEMPALDISLYQNYFNTLNAHIILPDFNDEAALLIIKMTCEMELPIGFYYQDEMIICDLIGDDSNELQEDYLEQLEVLYHFFKS